MWIGGYDNVAELKGELNILIKGLDNGSRELSKYEEMQSKCIEFLNVTKKDLEKLFEKNLTFK